MKFNLWVHVFNLLNIYVVRLKIYKDCQTYSAYLRFWEIIKKNKKHLSAFSENKNWDDECIDVT